MTNVAAYLLSLSGAHFTSVLAALSSDMSEMLSVRISDKRSTTDG